MSHWYKFRLILFDESAHRIYLKEFSSFSNLAKQVKLFTLMSRWNFFMFSWSKIRNRIRVISIKLSRLTLMKKKQDTRKWRLEKAASSLQYTETRRNKHLRKRMLAVDACGVCSHMQCLIKLEDGKGKERKWNYCCDFFHHTTCGKFNELLL